MKAPYTMVAAVGMELMRHGLLAIDSKTGTMQPKYGIIISKGKQPAIPIRNYFRAAGISLCCVGVVAVVAKSAFDFSLLEQTTNNDQIGFSLAALSLLAAVSVSDKIGDVLLCAFHSLLRKPNKQYEGHSPHHSQNTPITLYVEISSPERAETLAKLKGIFSDWKRVAISDHPYVWQQRGCRGHHLG